MVILTMAEGVLHILLVRRGQEPFKGIWALPGGFKRPEETLNEAARRELSEETGVDVPSLLTQFGAYGDPGRDPRMNVVTVTGRPAELYRAGRAWKHGAPINRIQPNRRQKGTP
jgi:8-oxo-dGTP diphosphatase